MLEGRHFQNAYVTRNIDKALAEFRLRARVRREMSLETSYEITTPSGTGQARSKIAFVWVDDLQYEFIEPVSGLIEVYRAGLPAGDGLAFHHICMRIDDWADFRARAEDSPWPIVLEGVSASVKFLYLDARAFLGHYLEFTWMAPETWTAMGGR
jgi:hypothetical protein